MKRIIIKIETTNAAFGESESDAWFEVARIMKESSSDMASGFQRRKLYDINGNLVGTIEAEGEDDE